MHYGQDYDNAFWDGTSSCSATATARCSTGSPSPSTYSATSSARVMEFTANLTYQGQSGALNESVADVFGCCVKQRLLGERSTPPTG